MTDKTAALDAQKALYEFNDMIISQAPLEERGVFTLDGTCSRETVEKIRAALAPIPRDATVALDALHKIADPHNTISHDEFYAAVEKVRAALNDAPEWQPIETAPLGSNEEPSTHFIGLNLNGGTNKVRRLDTLDRCYRNEHGVFNWCGQYYRATHWIPLPQPPKIAGGK